MGLVQKIQLPGTPSTHCSQHGHLLMPGQAWACHLRRGIAGFDLEVKKAGLLSGTEVPDPGTKMSKSLVQILPPAYVLDH